MKIKIISIGNKPPQWVKDAIKSYSDRVENHFKIGWVEIKPEKNFSSVKKKKELEAKKILTQINNDFIICLDENGVDCSSTKFSKNLSLWVQTYPSISFIIGGADGLGGRPVSAGQSRTGVDGAVGGNGIYGVGF